MPIMNPKTLQQLAESNARDYQSNSPFPHIVLDEFMPKEALKQVLDAFPSPEQLAFYQYDNPLEKKLAFDQLDQLPACIASLLQELNSPAFLRFLETLTGIEGLMGDPYYRGGGIHQIPKGGKLDVHVDFNCHPKLKLQRRLNALIYLNEDWDEDYGGHFELWSGRQEKGQHYLEQCEQSVLPIFNRFVLFNTSETSYHGHPEPLNCPENRTRKSIATYYYTVDRPEDEVADPHSTTFIKRPTDKEDEELEQLRAKRNQGRVSSNIDSGIRS